MTSIPRIVSATDKDAVALAADHLRRSGLVALPTETVYGLAADALSDVAVQHIYTTKSRPSNNPLIAHVADKEMAARYVDIPSLAEQLMDHFWPGPLTFVLPLKPNSGIARAVTAGLDTLAVRCPAVETTRQIIRALDGPVAAPSANPSGKLSPTSAKAVEDGLGQHISLIIDGGQTDIGIESTIIGIKDNDITLLRPGSVTAEDIEAVCGTVAQPWKNDTILAPGQLASHYAPNAAVKLGIEMPDDGDFYISFGPQSHTSASQAEAQLNLSPLGDLAEAAHNLFAMLKAADETGAKTIAIAPIPNVGIGIALNDRLKRAAAPRPK